MTLVSALVNKFLIRVGATDVAVIESSSDVLFAILAIVFIGAGILTIIRRKPYLNKYEAYTKESVARASAILGIGNVLVGVAYVFGGVLKLGTVPNLVIYLGTGLAIAALIVVLTIAERKLVKKRNRLIAEL